MHLERRFAAGMCAAAWLVASQVSAQPGPVAAPLPPSSEPPAVPAASAAPDTLETPYADTPAPPVATPPASAPPSRVVVPPAPAHIELAVPPADTRPPLPIRARRKLALLGEIGWNGLSGFGPMLTYHVDPRASVDLGAGLSLLGWKAGVRGRFNFLTTPLTPFLGVGFNATSGLGQVTTDPKSESTGDPNREPATIDVKASYLIQGVLGFDFIHRRGFTMVGCIGYAWLLNHDNVDLIAGTLSKDERQAFNIAFKGGAVVSFAAGYAFE